MTIRREQHFEVVNASIYYGRPTPGHVLLRNGMVVIHGTKRQCESAKTERQTKEPKMTKRTMDEIVDYIKSVKEEDFFGVMTNDCLAFLDFEHAKQFLKDTVTEAEFNDSLEGEEKFRNYPPSFVADYLPFAWDKANNCRGLSAGRSLQHLQARLWLCGYDVREAFDNYAYYGKRQLIIASLLCDFDWKEHDNGRWVNSEFEKGLSKSLVDAEVQHAQAVVAALTGASK